MVEVLLRALSHTDVIMGGDLSEGEVGDGGEVGEEVCGVVAECEGVTLDAVLIHLGGRRRRE